MLTEYEAVRDINTHICIFIYIRERVLILVVLSFREKATYSCDRKFLCNERSFQSLHFFFQSKITKRDARANKSQRALVHPHLHTYAERRYDIVDALFVFVVFFSIESCFPFPPRDCDHSRSGNPLRERLLQTPRRRSTGGRTDAEKGLQARGDEASPG